MKNLQLNVENAPRFILLQIISLTFICKNYTFKKIQKKKGAKYRNIEIMISVLKTLKFLKTIISYTPF